MEKQERASYLKIFLVVMNYWTMSISMVFANKYLVGSRFSSLDLSLFVAFFQCIISVVFVLFYTRAGKMCYPDIHPISYSPSIGLSRNMVVLSGLFVGMLSFNNLCLKHVGVAFFQIARSMTLIFTVMFSAIILKKYSSWKAICCCLIVVGGFILGVDQEKVAGTLSVRGVMYGVTTSVFVALVGITIKKALDIVDKDSARVTFYNNFNAAMLFTPLVLASGELEAFWLSDKASDVYFWMAMVVSGILGFLIAWASALQIHYTSPVTHHVSNNAKSVVQTIMAVTIYQESKPWLWWVSNIMVMTGALAYALVKMKEEKNQRQIEDNLAKGEHQGGSKVSNHVV
ncbi:GDP-fucose transporter 1-like [Lingula anatina]|uniref:GDP-fucose transporter 1-like n=1 Tax=Lingula anatina TaxID=7574 RepID=A0A1S3IE84_LINAN|nr:GDP-fucose transporter 1-like [Lingula anatina]|eukprot:XP_013396542.1 GDP-fucose transporter 1-like [Lingula anatina]